MTQPARRRSLRAAETRAAWGFVAPALLAVGTVAIVPIAWTAWESLHLHDLRMPWRGQPFVGAANFLEAMADARFAAAGLHTAAFVGVSVSLELLAGLTVALVLDRPGRGRGVVRTAALLPWALPTVVVAIIWRFAFEGPDSVASTLLRQTGLTAAPPVWFAGPLTAWVPIVLADVWRMTPFVAILLLASLQQIDGALYEAARLEGATRWQVFRRITLPLIAPALLVAALFRALDAVRVFDLIFVLSAGGPGTATESVSLYAFETLMRHLRFGYGSALSILIFAATFLGALLWVRALGTSALPAEDAR